MTDDTEEREMDSIQVTREGPYVGLVIETDSEDGSANLWLPPEPALAFSHDLLSALTEASMYAGVRWGQERAQEEEPGREAVRHLSPDTDPEGSEE